MAEPKPMNRGLHLAVVCDEFPPAKHGGTGSSYSDLAKGLTRLGHKVTVVGVSATMAHQKPIVERNGDITIHRLPKSFRFFGSKLGALEERFRLRRRLAKIHHGNQISLVEASDYSGWLSFGAVSGRPHVVRIRGSNLLFDHELVRAPQTLEHYHERRSLRLASHLASVSAFAARNTLELAGIAERKCEVIYNAVDTEFFSPGLLSEIKSGLIVFVNSLSARKGVEHLLRAFMLTLRRIPDAKLAIIGSTPGGQFYENHLRSILSEEASKQVEFVGRLERSDTLKWLRMASICCYPSLMETFGIAPVEAMSVGRPTIFSSLGPGPEIIDTGKDGILCDPTDEVDLSRSMIELLENRSWAEGLGESARQKVLGRFEINQWLLKNLDFYNSVCKEHGNQ